MALVSSVRSTDHILARWLPRVAALVVGSVFGALLGAVLVLVVWPGVMPGLEPRPLTAGAPARATAVLAALCGVAAAIFVTAFQASRDRR